MVLLASCLVLRILVFDAYIAMIPKVDGDATPLGQRPLSVLLVVCRIWASARMGWVSWRIGFGLGFWIPSLVLVVVAALLKLGIPLRLILRRFFLELSIPMFTVKSFDTVDRGVLDLVLSSLGLPGWFRHAYF